MQRLPNIEIRAGAYWFRKQEGGKRSRVYLCQVDEGQHALYAALARLHKPSANTVAELLDTFLAGADLKPVTLKAYITWAKQIKLVFGDMHPHAVEAADIAQFLEIQRKAGKGTTGNRQRAVLSSAYTFGLRNGLVDRTPFTVNIRRNKETPRKRYVRDEEYQDALNRATPAFRCFLELAYLTGLRQKDLRELTRDQLTDNGILVEESKTGRRVLIGWSDALRDAVRRSISRSDGLLVLTNTLGRGWSQSALQSAMKRLNVDWTLHDLRAKAESDHAEGLGLLPLYKRDRRVTPVK